MQKKLEKIQWNTYGGAVTLQLCVRGTLYVPSAPAWGQGWTTVPYKLLLRCACGTPCGAHRGSRLQCRCMQCPPHFMPCAPLAVSSFASCKHSHHMHKEMKRVLRLGLPVLPVDVVCVSCACRVARHGWTAVLKFLRPKVRSAGAQPQNFAKM